MRESITGIRIVLRWSLHTRQRWPSETAQPQGQDRDAIRHVEIVAVHSGADRRNQSSWSVGAHRKQKAERRQREERARREWRCRG